MQPAPYARSFGFAKYQADNPSNPVPGYRIDNELDSISSKVNLAFANLALIQRDDGLLRDGCITVDAVSPTLFAAIAAAAPPGPKGDPGAPGAPGAPGNPGANAANPAFTVVANTLAPGAAATAAITGAYPNLTLTIGVPKGDPAPAGAAVLADATYGDIKVTGGGTVFTVLTIPAHTHVIANVTGLQAALDAKANLASADFAILKQGGNSVLTTADKGATVATLVGGKIPVAQLPTTAEADAFGNLLYCRNDGVTEIGSTLDFHIADNDGLNFAVRATAVVNGGGYKLSFSANALEVGGVTVALVGHTHAIANITGLQAALDGKQPVGAYIDSSQLATKADAFTTVSSLAADTVFTNADNGKYIRATGAIARTFTFGNLTAGFALILVNRGTVNMPVACPGGYYKNGAAAAATANLSLAPGGKLTAFHEGGGIWTLEGTGF